MSDLKVNSIAGAVLASVLGVMGLGVGADALFHPHYPEKPGFMPDVQAEASGGGGPAQEGPPDFGTLLGDPAQLADFVARGERVHAQCVSCHTFEAGGANKTGPNLHEVFGRAAGAVGGFNYSDALKGSGVTWSYDTLDTYLTSPARAIPGNKMAFAGIRRTEDRVAMIAYLRSLEASPPPLPAPQPAAPVEAAAPAEGAAPAAAPTAG